MTLDWEARRAAERAKYAADMEGMPALDDGKWEWWIGPNEEWYYTSEATREGAIQVGRDEYEDGFSIVEARKAELDLAAVFDLDQFQDAVEDRFEDDIGENHQGFLVMYRAEDLARLETAVRQAIRQWQVAIREETGRSCKPWTFTETRNSEWFPAETEGGEE